MRTILLAALTPLFLFAGEAETNPKPEPIPNAQVEAKKAETDKGVKKMEQERATRPPAETAPAQVKNEDPRVRMDRLKEESQQAGGTEGERIERYRRARELAEAEEKARKEKEAQQKAKPAVVDPQK